MNKQHLNFFLYAMLLAFSIIARADEVKSALPPDGYSEIPVSLSPNSLPEGERDAGSLREFPVNSRPHKVVFHVSDEEAKKWHLTVNNATNVLSFLGKDNVAMEIVVYGPAIGMLKFESEAGPGLQNLMAMGAKVIACERTMHGDHLVPDDMLPEIGYTHTGVAYLMEKQKQGYAYIRP
jgi:intracellular sulfur oxidation DsrE/DsrF family protein